MIECACGCEGILTKYDSNSRIRHFITNHQLNIIRHVLQYNLPKGPTHYNWKGGKSINSQGYMMVKCKGHPRAKVSYRYRVREHILVMEKHLGRYLTKDEAVHHINGVKTDNRIENLKLMTVREHDRLETTRRWKEGLLVYKEPKRDPTTGRFMPQKFDHH